MKIWVITGDKQETAKNIAYSAGLFEKDKEPIYLNDEKLNEILKIHANKAKKQDKPIWRWRTNKAKKIKLPDFNENTPHQGEPQLTARQSLRIRNSRIPMEMQKFNLLVTGQMLQTIIANK